MPVCRGRIKREDVVATVPGDDITIGGQRTAVVLIKMISKKYEIRKHLLRVTCHKTVQISSSHR